MAPNVHNSLAIQKKHVASMYRFVGQEGPTGSVLAACTTIQNVVFPRHCQPRQETTDGNHALMSSKLYAVD